MTEKEYTERRAVLVGQAMNIDVRFFPRCVRARVRMIARLDSEHRGIDYDVRKAELYEQWFNA